jgi:hypothetical protein
MAKDIRQQIVEAVVTRFQTITTGNGYETNIGNNVKRWRAASNSPFAAGDLNVLNIKDTQATPNSDDTPMGVTEYELEIHAEAATRDATIATDETCRKMLADLIKACGTDRRWSDLAWDTRLETSSLDVQQVGDIIGGCQLAFIIIFRTPNFDPYTTQH